jgi:hypothetical protein
MLGSLKIHNIFVVIIMYNYVELYEMSIVDEKAGPATVLPMKPFQGFSAAPAVWGRTCRISITSPLKTAENPFAWARSESGGLDPGRHPVDFSAGRAGMPPRPGGVGREDFVIFRR